MLTDIVMPEMDGIELARRATELDPEIKVMFITGFAAVALNPDNAAPKDARILSKPFHLRELVSEVERLLQGGLTGPLIGFPFRAMSDFKALERIFLPASGPHSRAPGKPARPRTNLRAPMISGA